jgi:single-strand DNA-binding protein
MSGSLNKVMIIGNLGKDPEVRTIPTGAKVANFSIATNESYTDKNGQSVDRTEWHRIVMWRGLADIAERYLRKGSTVFVEGKLATRSWDDQNGQKRYTTEIVASQMQMLGARQGESRGAPDQGGGQFSTDPYSGQGNSGQGNGMPGGGMAPGMSPASPGLGAMPPAAEDDLPF